MNIADIKELVADRRLINGERGYELDHELADSIEYLLSIIVKYEEALTQIKKHPLPQHHLCEAFLTVQSIARQALTLQSIQREG